MSGNLLIACDDVLYLHYFVIKSHDISKLRFVDFEEVPVSFELSFVPTQIALGENYIACLSPVCIHFFKISSSSSSSAGTAAKDGLIETNKIDLNGELCHL